MNPRYHSTGGVQLALAIYDFKDCKHFNFTLLGVSEGGADSHDSNSNEGYLCLFFIPIPSSRKAKKPAE